MAPESLIALYRQTVGREPASVEPITGSGSSRQYFRLDALIGCQGTSAEENRAFLYLARHFEGKGLPVPHVVAVGADEMTYLQEDLGATSLFDAVRQGRERGGVYDEREQALLLKAVRLLPHVQIRGAEQTDWNMCYPQPAMDEDNVMFDLNYFKYLYLRLADVDFHELRLQDDFRSLSADLLAEGGTWGFMYRDYQARNIMLRPDALLALIDFQGGRRGPVEYDLAAFAMQASARYPEPLRQEMLEAYTDELSKLTPVDPEALARRYQRFVLFRLLQVLGAYGYRGLWQRKQHFLDSITPAIESLRRTPCPYPELARVIERMGNPDSPIPQR